LREKKKFDWTYSVLPAAVATGPVGTIISLYILELNGKFYGTIYTGLATALASGVTIPASMFWGYVTDKIHSRRLIIFSGYTATSFVLFYIFFARSTIGAITSYGLFSFVSASTATPINLLIMETEPKEKWTESFARLSMVSSIGNTVGLLVSTFWSSSFPVLELTLPLGFLSLVSSVLSLLMLKDPVITFERETMVKARQSFFTRLLSLPTLFLSIPHISDFKRVFRGLRYGLTSYLPLLYISIVCFYLSSGLFNASFVPALSSHNLSQQEIFGITLAGMAVQTVSFQFAGKYIASRSLSVSAIQGLVLRGSSYTIIGISSFLFTNTIVPASIFYPLAAGVGFAIYYTASNVMIFNSLQHKNPGSNLGVYSAIVGIANTVGSTLSGFLSAYFGFESTFILSGFLLGLSAYITYYVRGHFIH
jgi:MFS family permease